MSSNRSSVASRRENDNEISELIFKLQALLPERNHRNLKRVATREYLEEIIKYIKKLNEEVDDLSGKVSELLASPSYSTDSLFQDVLPNILHHF